MTTPIHSASAIQPNAVSRTGHAPSTGRFQSLRLFTFLAALLLAMSFAPSSSQAQDNADLARAPASVNINTDDAAALASGLTGVGLSRAEDIIRYREQFGRFTTVEQLSEVKGIGKATLEKNRTRITLE